MYLGGWSSKLALVLALVAAAPAYAGNLSVSSSAVNDSTTGNNNGTLDPGESVTFNLTLANSVVTPGTCGFVPFPPCPPAAGRTGVDATLGAPRSVLVTYSQSTSPYPDLPEGSNGANTTPFAFKLGDSAPCGKPVTMAALVTSNEANESVGFSVPTGEPGSPVTYNATVPGGGTNVPDGGGFPGVTSTLTISTPGYTKDVNLTFNVTENHDEDLTVLLTGPNGAAVYAVLSSASGANFTNTVIDDAAAASIATGGAPYSGSYKPYPGFFMSSFNNIQQQGDWKLNVADGNSGSGHTGTVTLNSWSLSITPAVCAAVPAPPAPTTPPAGQNQTPSPPPTPDTTAPVLGIGGVPNTLTRKAFLGGVKFAATTNEAATLTWQLLGATAKAQLAAKKKPKPPPFNLVLGSGRSPFALGLRTLKAKPSKRLVGRAKRFTVKVVVTATDAAGNRSSKSAKVKITP